MQTYKKWIAIILPVLLAFLFFGSMLFDSLKTFGGNFSGFIHLKRFGIARNPFVKNNPELRRSLLVFDYGGHDTKFYYTVAFDPFLTVFSDRLRIYSRMVDSPRIRYSRIGYPLLINFFSAGEPDTFPKTMVWLVLMGHCFGIFFLAKILLSQDHSPYWSLFYLLIPGLSVSTLRVMPEPLSGAFLLAGVFFYLKERLLLCAMLLACAILIRESNIIIVLVAGAWEFFSKNRFRAWILLCSLIPYAGWKLFLTYRLFPAFGWTTLYHSAQVLTFPFHGIWVLFRTIANDQYPPDSASPAMFFAILLSGIFLISVYLLIKQRSLITIILFCYSLLAVSLNFDKSWSGFSNAERTTFECFIFLIIASCLVKVTSRIPIKAVLLTFYLITLLYDLFFLSTKEAFRAGLMFSALFR